jgi:hypothetical protein
MRRILGVLLAALVLLLATAESSNSCANNGNGGAGGSSGGTKAAAAAPTLGQILKVGDLDLVVGNPRPVNTRQYNQFNDEDYAVDVQISDARGDKYSFSPSAVKVVDTNGVVHEGSYGCTGCPNVLDSTDLVKGGHAQGTVYFKLAGAVPKEIDYQALLSTNKVAIPLQ